MGEPTAEEYRARAEGLAAQADTTSEPYIADMLRVMARDYLTLAEQLERGAAAAAVKKTGKACFFCPRSQADGTECGSGSTGDNPE